MSKILVVDDDIALSEALKALLTVEKHIVDVVNDGLTALEFLKTYDYDLLILDWQVPGCEGIDICRQYRESGGSAYIMMLTGQSAIEFKEEGLDSGADDYITKPFLARELCARIRALLRRPVKSNNENILQIANLTLDMKRHDAFIDGTSLKLMPLELSLLEFLATHPNEVFSSEALLKRIWSADAEVGADSLYACLTRLRKKLKAHGLANLIQTVHGVGYRFELPE